MNLKTQQFQFELLSLIVYKILFHLQHTLMPDVSEFLHESHFLTYLSTTLKCVSILINSVAYIYLLGCTTLTFLKCAVFPIGG